MHIAGWELVHCTDRVIELRKDTPAYRRITNRPGYVRVRAESGMDRKELIETAIAMAKKNDERIATFIGTQYAPDLARLARYQGRQVQLKHVFATKDQEPERKVYRP